MNNILKMVSDAISYSMLFVGKFYKWGGDDPSGFDCSGFVIEVLKSVGILPRRGDWAAQSLYQKFISHKVEKPSAGCLAFWWNKSRTKVIHIELCIDNYRTIGASGGGSKTTSVSEAIKQNAFIKIRPINYERGGKIEFINPFLGV